MGNLAKMSKAYIDRWYLLIIVIVSLGVMYLVSIMTFASTVFKQSTLKKAF